MGYQILRAKKKSGEILWFYHWNAKAYPLSTRVDTLAEFLKSQSPAELAAIRSGAQSGVPLSELEVLSPVTAPCQIVCQGKNYMDHLLETGVAAKDKDYNILFTKADSSLAPPVGKITRPGGIKLLDYEVELGLVLGRELQRDEKITQENLPSVIAGLVLANDLSARDVQVPQRQWFKGKSFYGFCPVGPFFYWMEPEDFSELLQLELFLRVNGEKRQQASTQQLLYKPWETLTEIASIFQLRVGDLLLTGTPGGVAMRVAKKKWWEEMVEALKSDKQKMREFVETQSQSRRYLQKGDLVEAYIRGKNIDLGQQYLTVE